MTSDETSLHAPARDIPLPRHLSPEAHAQFLQETMSNPPWPAPDDIQGWRDMIAPIDQIGLGDWA